MIIYLVINEINGKRYVGQTAFTLKKRKQEHFYEVKSNRDNSYFHKALRKYDPGTFKWKVIHKCNNKDELNKLEIYYIGYYNTFENGYNLAVGGNGSIGYKHTDEAKQKMSVFQKGKEFCEKYRKKISENAKKRFSDIENHPMYGKKHTEKAKRKMSKLKKGKKFTEEHKRNISKAKKDKPCTEEHKRKISMAKKGILKTEETKKRMSIAKIGIKLPPHTKERREIQSIALKNYWKNKKLEAQNGIKEEHQATP